MGAVKNHFHDELEERRAIEDGEIEGVDPTEADIGRNVIYHGYAGERESGYITSFNEYFVFVRYGMGSTSQATRRDQLTWAA